MPDSFEFYFRQRGATALLIPVRSDGPQWLRERAAYRGGGSDGSALMIQLSLIYGHNAVIYIESTTPVTNLE